MREYQAQAAILFATSSVVLVINEWKQDLRSGQWNAFVLTREENGVARCLGKIFESLFQRSFVGRLC